MVANRTHLDLAFDLVLRWGMTSLASNSIDRMILSCGVVYICMNSNASSTPGVGEVLQDLAAGFGAADAGAAGLDDFLHRHRLRHFARLHELLHEEFV